MDWMSGEVIRLLDSLGLAENTLVFFSSDNGPVLDDGYADFAEEKNGRHLPAGKFRGGKYSAYEGGTRVPQLVYWPGRVKAGETNALFSHIDLFASIASLLGLEHTADNGTDSENMLSTLLGDTKTGRSWMLEESFTLSLRKGNWKYIAPQEKATPDWLANKRVATGLQPDEQLYDLGNDPGETKNLAAQHPALVQEFRIELERIKNP